jgi:hypothetical protein
MLSCLSLLLLLSAVLMPACLPTWLPRSNNNNNKTTTTQPQFYTADQYAKRLVGNAYSVPVLDIILRPLQKMFASKRYEGYTYAFEWKESGPEINDYDDADADNADADDGDDDDSSSTTSRVLVSSSADDNDHDHDHEEARLLVLSSSVPLAAVAAVASSSSSMPASHPQPPDEDEQQQQQYDDDDDDDQKPSAISFCIHSRKEQVRSPKREDNNKDGEEEDQNQKAPAHDNDVDDEKESPAGPASQNILSAFFLSGGEKSDVPDIPCQQEEEGSGQPLSLGKKANAIAGESEITPPNPN